MTFLPGFRHKPAAAGSAVARAGVSFDGVDDKIAKTWTGKTVSNSQKFTAAGWFEVPTGASGETSLLYSVTRDNGVFNAVLTGSDGYLGLFSAGTPLIFFQTDNGSVYGLQKGASTISYGTKYFMMFVFDSTQATATDRMKIWFGPYAGAVSLQTWTDMLGGSSIGLNESFVHGSGTSEGEDRLGWDGSTFFKGKLGDIYWLDGQTLADPSSLVDSYANNAKPKAYTGVYGNTGFHLDFSSSGSLGTDSSGNGNNFTPSGGPTQISTYL